MKVKGMISEAPPRSSLTEGAPQRSGEGSWAEERGGEGGGCYATRMEIGEEAVFKTAGFRVREAEARGLCVDADRDDARRAVEGVADRSPPARSRARCPGPSKRGVRRGGLTKPEESRRAARALVWLCSAGETISESCA